MFENQSTDGEVVAEQFNEDWVEAEIEWFASSCADFVPYSEKVLLRSRGSAEGRSQVS
jgi:hypothetical protein